MNDPTRKRTPADVAAMARHYLDRSQGNARAALEEAISDALWAQQEAQEREQQLLCGVSHGYVQAGSSRRQ